MFSPSKRQLANSFSALLVIAAPLLGGCLQRAAVEPPAERLEAGRLTGRGGTEFVTTPTPAAFSICHGHTCRHVEAVSLTADDWAAVRAVFRPQPADAAAERERIRDAVALLETLVGARTGTAGDLGRNIAGFGKAGQLDCIDESTNSSVYLALLDGDGLLRFHRPRPRTARGPMTGVAQAPHSTAVIEADDGERYAVDSWFLANGEPPFVVPMRAWRRGWQPGD